VSRALALAATALAAALAPALDGDWRVELVDVAEQAGLRQTSVYGGLDHKRFIIETNGAGVAWIDYDNDGWPDAFVLSGTRLGRPAQRRRTGCIATTTTAPSAT
jgi:hypothetical protein